MNNYGKTVIVQLFILGWQTRLQRPAFTHTSKSHKMTHLRHHTYGDKYHCRPNNKRSKLSIRNTTQNCGKYDVRYTHDNYSNNYYNCKYENYRGYHKRRMKKQSTAVQIGSLNQTSDERIEKERSNCNERKRDFVWPRGKTKMLPYQQVTSTIKTNVAVIQWNADVVYRRERTMVSTATTLQRNNIRPVDDGQYNCYKRGVRSNDTLNSELNTRK